MDYFESLAQISLHNSWDMVNEITFTLISRGARFGHVVL